MILKKDFTKDFIIFKIIFKIFLDGRSYYHVPTYLKILQWTGFVIFECDLKITKHIYRKKIFEV